jgi:hypothetical protein
MGGNLCRVSALAFLMTTRRKCSMRYSVILSLLVLGLSGCVSVDSTPRPATTTVIAPAAPAPVDTTTTTTTRKTIY